MQVPVSFSMNVQGLLCCKSSLINKNCLKQCCAECELGGSVAVHTGALLKNRKHWRLLQLGVVLGNCKHCFWEW
jgi:hypothetical protein